MIAAAEVQMVRSSVMLGAALASLLLAGPVGAAETISTFTTDSLSFISFGDREVLPIPPGSTIKFRFGTPAADGSVGFTIRPEDVNIAPISLPNGQGRLAYTIRSIASGRVTPTANGRTLAFDAVVRATRMGANGGGSFDYTMPFTTERVEATNKAGSRTIAKTGMRLVEGVWYAQIVGATTNERNAFPEPGSAVYTILSGQFDEIP